MDQPSPNDVNRVISQLEQLSTPQPSARQLAQRLIAERKGRQVPPALSQAMIDSGGDSEERRRRFVASAVRFKRRGWLSWLLR